MERIGTVAILGVGLIGGSVGMAVRARGLAGRVIGIGRDPAKLDEALRLGAIDIASTGLAHAVSDADVVIVCTPVSRVAADCCDLARFAPDRALITDVGSTKAAIVSAIEHDPRARSMFCGAHPIAGSERQGVAHARADLFEGRSCVITPSLQTPSDRESRAMQFWEALGCKVLVMSPQKHDEALALTSHLPHAVASALAGTVPEALHTLAAGAFRDGTRVASADSGLWTDIFLANREGTLSALSRFEERLAKFRRALTEYDALALASWWTEGRDARDRFAFPAARPDDPAPPGDSPCST